MNDLTHINEAGQAEMVDVTDKAVTQRVATAEATVTMKPETLKLIIEGGHKKAMFLVSLVLQECKLQRNAQS